LAAAASAPEPAARQAPERRTRAARRGAGAGTDRPNGAAGAAEVSDRARPAAIGGSPGRLILAGALLAALLVIAAEFMTLYQAHLASRPAPIQSVTAGSHHSYAMIPIAVVGAALAVMVWRTASRPALLAIALLGVVALLIGLLDDLPAAHAVGLVDDNGVSATTTPSAGLYVETFGAILLIATSGLAFAMLGLPRPAIGAEQKSRTERK
jgi:hypothetical protein